MCLPSDNALLEIQEIASHHPQEQLVGPSEEQSAMQGIDMSPPQDNILLEMQDVGSHGHVEDHPPAKPSGEQSRINCCAFFS